ncbi:MAG: hypothetical protein LLG20_08810 [Acidobacteriales bacterium]|nr:hypothetical protein [Terriglobales bacterium]
MRVRIGFVRGEDFRVNRFGFNRSRVRRGEGGVPAQLAELIEDGLVPEGELAFAGGFDLFMSESDEGHDLGSVGIVAGEVVKPRDAGGLFR